MLFTTGIAIIVAAGIAFYALRTKQKTPQMYWAWVLMIVGTIVTIIGLWTTFDDRNTLTWILNIAATIGLSAVLLASLSIFRSVGVSALLGPRRNSAAGLTPGEEQ
ncbi:hypothetical protein CH262_03280 [Rhodococcus sp. 05-2255-1e]|jgi:multisubunit Na+/H+ antiporter MnhB subunit|uniref:hypothetical protein n=1 Tax=Rhodococcus sp. 05-2255-1e TaxID=2022495 RepID=UPI000B9C1B54|nr:hypothetical protein [Rhodococcus sp. 05-2255-1e]OZE28353.1 hypothetical protein CH262_03280 [Rhodococcus sp. 05-2255-1e]